MKKATAKILLTLLLLTAALSHPLTAHAIQAPTSPAWTGPGQLTFYATNGADTRYFIEVYCDGNRMTRYDAGVCIEGTVARDIRFVMDTAGTYTFRVKAAESDYDYDFNTGAVSNFSEGYWLSPAENRLGTPQDLRWGSTKEGLAVWNSVEGAAKYHVILYDNGSPVRGFLTFDNYYTQENLLPYMSSDGGHSYTFSVMAVSSDPGQTGNSERAFSGTYTGSTSGGGSGYVPVDPPETLDPRVPFTDVMSGRYYSDAVVWAYEKGYLSGYTDGRFGVNDVCTRGQIVTILHNIYGNPQPANTYIRFTDVPGSAYYAVPVLWATERGITAGIGDNKFGPERGCTRAQIVTFLWNMNGAPTSFPDGTGFWVPFGDVPQDAWYRTSVGWAKSNNFIAGMSEGIFAPDEYCTRAQVAVILQKMFGG